MSVDRRSDCASINRRVSVTTLPTRAKTLNPKGPKPYQPRLAFMQHTGHEMPGDSHCKGRSSIPTSTAAINNSSRTWC